MQAFYRIVDLPWSLSVEEERKFRQFLLKVIGTVFVLSLVIPFLPVPEKDPDAVTEVPPRYAKLVLEKKAPPPPPPKPEPIEELEPEPLPEPEKVVEKEPEPEPEPVIEEPKPDPTELARENASKAGVLAFADDLADLRELDSVSSVVDNRDLAGASQAAGRSERSLITSSAGTSSGGINTASLSRDTGGAGGLSSRNTTQVGSSNIQASQAAKKKRERETGVASRSREEIEMIFDRNKGAIFALYNRALRRDPTLQGKLVLKLTIAPSGKVTACEVVSSELADPELERKLVQRVKLFNFGAKDVSIMTTTKPIDFFPA
ncbi:MAG: AgmX/PglI C-terminal domain-containing protein [Pseudomonadota bacterium]